MSTAPSVREAQVQAAVQFLSNPKVVTSSLSRKVKFLLESKGLTEAEILLALQRYAPDAPDTRELEAALKEGRSGGILAAALAYEQSIAGDSSGAKQPIVTTTTTVIPTSLPPTSTTSSSSSSAALPTYNYLPPAGFIFGPPTSRGGPPSLIAIPSKVAPAASSGSSWSTIAMTTAGVLGSVAAAGAIAHKAFGWTLKQEPVNSVTALQAQLLSVPSSITLSLPSPDHASSSTAAAFGLGSADHRLAAAATHETGLIPDLPDNESVDEPEEKYLSAWTGESSSSIKRRHGISSNPTTAELAYEVRGLSDKLDSLLELLRDNGLELRKMNNRPTENSNPRLEQLLEKSNQTQNDTLATLKIMLAGQAKATAAALASSSALPAASPSSGGVSMYNAESSLVPFTKPSFESSPSTSDSSNSYLSSAHSPKSSLFNMASTAGLLPTAADGNVDALVEGPKCLEAALTNLRESNTVVDDVKTAVSSMLLYMGNLHANPSQPRYRRIILPNSAYESRVRKVKGAQEYLLAAGFELGRSCIEFIIPPSGEFIASGAAKEGTGSGLIMNETQKLQQLQTALELLRGFQQDLLSRGADALTSSSSSGSINASADGIALTTSSFFSSSASGSSQSLPSTQPQPLLSSYSAYASSSENESQSSSQQQQQQQQPPLSTFASSPVPAADRPSTVSSHFTTQSHDSHPFSSPSTPFVSQLQHQQQLHQEQHSLSMVNTPAAASTAQQSNDHGTPHHQPSSAVADLLHAASEVNETHSIHPAALPAL